jgi:steroid 5-alpha reductase family enzyme
MGTVLLTAALAIVVLMICTWIASIVVKNASIVDIIWGFGFVVVAWVVRLTVDDGNETRGWLLVAMTSLWGLRLTAYLFLRNHGKGEDFRYRAMRRKHGSAFAIKSLYTVFAFQGLMMWIVSLPVQAGQADRTPDLGWLAWIGCAVWLIGLFFEAVGDAQLAAFKRDPGSQGVVMDRGLWRYTRHPNYFGDACVWWGIGMVGAETGHWWVLVGPVLMTVLLRRVSGVTLLEKSLVKRRTGYDEYVARTSPFLPRPPRRLP